MAANINISGGNSVTCDTNNATDPEREQPFLVQAVYSFKGKNNDELCFKKGDIITVTQVEEGGWWEGTLEEKTGWFPSNYVNEYKTTNSGCVIGGHSANCDAKNNAGVDIAAQQKVYRSVVLKDLIDSERAHLTELQGLMYNFLIPLEKAELMKNSEYNQLINNLHDVVSLHDGLLSSLVEVSSFPGTEQRVGKIFLTIAPQLKQVLTKYCTNHPRSICILDRYKQELNAFMESNGAASPGILVLTAGLSKPFRRLEKYAGMLQELERHVEENHVDRGDTQRSVAVFKDIASLCSVIRRQKEIELEVISGGVRGWEGEDLSCLGDIIHMGSVAVGSEHHDRYLVLFPSTLLMLSVSHRMSAFIYEGKLPLAGISVNKLDDANDTFKNSFEIVGPMIERIVAVCQTKEDQQTWVDLIRQQIRSIRVSSPLPSTPAPPPHSPIANNSIPNLVSSSSSGISQQSPHIQQHSVTQLSTLSRPWSVSCLRPSPPLRTLLIKEDKASTVSQQTVSPGPGQHRNSTRKPNERCFEEDAQILRVIEGYCASVKSRYTISSVCAVDAVTNQEFPNGDGDNDNGDGATTSSHLHLHSPSRASLLDGHQNCQNNNNNNFAPKSLTMPQLLIAEEEKLIMDDINGSSIIMNTTPSTKTVSSMALNRNNTSNCTSYNKTPAIEEKSLVDTVYTLKEEVTTLHCKLAALSDRLLEERQARNQLQAIVNNCLLSNPAVTKNNIHLIPAQYISSTNSTTAAN